MIEVHLYGKLRRYSDNAKPTSQSIASVSWQPGDTVVAVVERLGIPMTDLGSNIFLNGRYATLESPIQRGDRLGLFPDDMQLLYKWYFAPKNGEEPRK
ncbi:MoaD/ThiS family protein [Candidatus Bipolaricaulota bacterium]